jgi:hypothetical protein
MFQKKNTDLILFTLLLNSQALPMRVSSGKLNLRCWEGIKNKNHIEDSEVVEYNSSFREGVIIHA